MQKEPDKKDISLIRVENERDIHRFNLDELAIKITNGNGPVRREFPIYLVFYKGKLTGYFHALQKTVIYPAFDLETLKSGEIIRVVRSLVTEMKRHAGDPLFVVCKRVEEFREEKMRFVRLKRSEDSLWLYDEDAP